MLEKEILALIAIAIGLLGFFPYSVAIIKKQVVPHVFTWGVWSLIAVIATAAQISDGAGPGAWATGAASLQTLIIAILALKNGQKDITKSDWFSLFLALLAIPLWVMTYNPLWAVILVSLSDAFGFYPSFRKGYIKPWEDSVIPFSTAAIKFSLSIFAMSHISFVTILYPLSIVTLNVTFIAMLIVRRRFVFKSGYLT